MKDNRKCPPNPAQSPRIHHPDYKAAKLGYTRVPTKIAEDHLKWGLTKNGLILYLFLASRVKKKTWFNGRTLKPWMKGVIDGTAIAGALKNLVEAGFCTKRIHKDKNGRIAGWDYSFYAIPRVRARVAEIDSEVCDKLDAIGWFDHETDHGSPDSGSPDSGEAPCKEKEVVEAEGNERRKTPNPLHEEEGHFDFSSDEGDDLDFPGNVPPPSPQGGARVEKTPWRDKMMATPAGANLLAILRPDQIPHDAALRPVCKSILKGDMAPAYIAFLEDHVIRPNQASADRNGKPLKSIQEILKLREEEGYKPDGPAFRRWLKQEQERLSYDWHRLHIDVFDENLFRHRLQELLSHSYPIDLRVHNPGPLDPPTVPPLHFYAAYCRFYNQYPLGFDPTSDILEEFGKVESWRFLLMEAALDIVEFNALHLVVGIYHSRLAPRCATEIQQLRNNWYAWRNSLREGLVRRFSRIGATPPPVEPTGRENGAA